MLLTLQVCYIQNIYIVLNSIINLLYLLILIAIAIFVC